MSHNPLILGNPYGTTSNLNVDSSVPPQAPTTSSGSLEKTPPAAIANNMNSHTGSSPEQNNVSNTPSYADQNADSGSTRPIPRLEHTRTAPTTVPINPVYHQTDSSMARRDRSDSESPTPTLSQEQDGAVPIPLAVGGLHGQPLPASKTRDEDGRLVGELHEKDHQATGLGGRTGPEIAALAKKELGVDTTDHDEHRDEFNEKAHPPVSPVAMRKVERTTSGTQFPRNTFTASGGETVTGLGMVPLTRNISQPPAVSIFGGVAPSGIDAEEGLRPVRSHEEEEEREAMRAAKGPDPWSVRFEPGEKTNPKNWGVVYRWYLTGIAGLLVLNSTFASSSPSGIIEDMIKYFGFSQEVAILTISLFVAGYCVGPLLWGPLSEAYGRRPIFISSFIVYTGMQVGCALSKNTASILIFRFLGGCFASAPLTNSGALLADIWDTDHRGQAMSIFALAPFAGPSIGPIVAGFISVSGTSWRWVYWILTIFASVCLVVIVFSVPETYAPKLLAQKAKRLRKDTGEQRWYAPLEKSDHSFKARLNDILLKPFIMLALEPMLLAVTLYMSFVYGVVYLLFEAYPFVFVKNHGFNTGEEGLAFLGFFGGGFAAVIFFMTVIEPRYLRHAAKLAPQPPKPEKRLELCIISGWALVIAMFWFGWTSYSSIHWISPVLAGSLIGVGVLGMFVSLFNYIIDVYLWAAASALAATTVCRSVAGAAFPLFATQMYEKLGTQWASSLLGFLALVMAPIPIILTIYGPALRLRSKYSPNKMT